VTGAESITVTCCPVCSATECAKLLTTETVEAPAPVAICAVTVSPISTAPIASRLSMREIASAEFSVATRSNLSPDVASIPSINDAVTDAGPTTTIGAWFGIGEWNALT
jgi:hypothetical protein